MALLKSPIEGFVWKGWVSQLFGVGAENYTQFGIPGHNGTDVIIPGDPQRGYGLKVKAAHDGKITGLVSDFPTKTRGNGLYLMQRLPDGRYMETAYWHLADFTVVHGQEIKQGDTIGLVGNTGYVFPKPSKEAPYLGTHLHFGLRFYNEYGQLIDNDYNGYCDPVPYLYNPGDRLPLFLSSTLTVGSTGTQVSWLQTILKLEGLAKDYEPLAYFGNKTFRDVRILQSKYGLLPTGIVTQPLRDILNAKYA